LLVGRLGGTLFIVGQGVGDILVGQVTRRGEGLNRSDRVTLTWPDGAIANTWVEITVKSNASGGWMELAADDVFYFGNSVGDCDGDGVVGDGDYDVLVSEFGLRGDGLAADINGDRQVDLADFANVRVRYGETVVFSPALLGDADRNGVVNDEDYVVLMSQFGLQGHGLTADLNGDGQVSLADFVVIRSSLGNTPPAPAPVTALQAAVDPIAAAAAPAPPIVSQPLDPRDMDDDIIATAASAPGVNLSAELPAAASYVSEPRQMSIGSPSITLHRAATGESDLRALGDDLTTDGEDELLADILAESALALPL
jgi:hypothetical protein